MKEGLLRCNRRRAGLGYPPSQFTTNASESINALIKNKMDYELPVFLDKLKEVIDEQERELEQTVINCGKYHFCTDYQYLVKEQSDGFLKMSCVQREAHLNKVAKADLQKKATATSHTSNLSSISSREHIEDYSSASQNEAGLCNMPTYSHCKTEYQSVEDREVPLSSQHLIPFQQEEFETLTKRNKRTCSRRLFESQY